MDYMYSWGDLLRYWPICMSSIFTYYTENQWRNYLWKISWWKSCTLICTMRWPQRYNHSYIHVHKSVYTYMIVSLIPCPFFVSTKKSFQLLWGLNEDGSFCITSISSWSDVCCSSHVLFNLWWNTTSCKILSLWHIQGHMELQCFTARKMTDLTWSWRRSTSWIWQRRREIRPWTKLRSWVDSITPTSSVTMTISKRMEYSW